MSRSSERVGAWIIRYLDVDWHPLRWLSVALVLFIVSRSLPPIGVDHIPGRVAQATNEIVCLQTALNVYQTDYGILPSGSQADIVRALLGDNPQKTIYLELRPGQLDSAGEFIDPWGSSYRIDLSGSEQPRIHSPGKNKRDELDAPGSDDVCSWKL